MIKRNIQAKIEHWLGKEKILILKGARQVGKTTILKAIQKKLEEKKCSTVYLEADQFGSEAIFSSPDHFIAYLEQYHSLKKGFLYVFIDEIQHIKNVGIFLKNIFDAHKQDLQLIVSGSSSLEITKNTEFLTGRAISFSVSRVSFAEYFNFEYKTVVPPFSLTKAKKDFVSLKEFYTISRTKLEPLFIRYIEFGGYPEVLTQSSAEDKKMILQSIIKTYIEKDIGYFFSIKNISAFNSLLKILASEIGQMLNKNSISNTLNIDNSYLSQYLDILEGTYVSKRIYPYFTNVRSEISKMPKNFLLDMGIRNLLLFSFESVAKKIDLGAEAENFVCTELLNKFNEDQIHYYRTISGSEIDFVIEKSFEELILIEVKYRENPGSILSMKNFEAKYPDKKIMKLVLTKNTLDIRDSVYYVPVCLLPFIDFEKSN